MGSRLTVGHGILVPIVEVRFLPPQLIIMGRNKKYDWVKVQEFYNEGNSLRACSKHFGMAKRTLEKAVKRGDLKTRPPLTPITEFLVVGQKTSRHYLKQRIRRAGLLEYACQTCGIEEWRGQEIGLHLDHIDGNRFNNQISNLRFLCPNCHSQTETYAGRNRSNPNRALINLEQKNETLPD